MEPGVDKVPALRQANFSQMNWWGMTEGGGSIDSILNKAKWRMNSEVTTWAEVYQSLLWDTEANVKVHKVEADTRIPNGPLNKELALMTPRNPKL